jgi:hypothetical protein
MNLLSIQRAAFQETRERKEFREEKQEPRWPLAILAVLFGIAVWLYGKLFGAW